MAGVGSHFSPRAGELAQGCVQAPRFLSRFLFLCRKSLKRERVSVGLCAVGMY